jgi:hypothetical protein
MRAIFGVLSLLVVVAIVGVLAKKQLGAGAVTAPPVTAAPGAPPAPAGTPRQQVEQFKQGLDATLQQPRPMPDDDKK